MEALEIRYNALQFNDDEFFNFCQQNDTLKFERTADGTIIIMPNTGGETGIRNAALTAQLYGWNKAAKPGRVFDSSTAFRLPSSAVRSADGAFVSTERWNALTPDETRNFRPSAPIL